MREDFEGSGNPGDFISYPDKERVYQKFDTPSSVYGR
jgi:hypothetical protein